MCAVLRNGAAIRVLFSAIASDHLYECVFAARQKQDTASGFNTSTMLALGRLNRDHLGDSHSLSFRKIVQKEMIVGICRFASPAVIGLLPLGALLGGFLPSVLQSGMPALRAWVHGGKDEARVVTELRNAVALICNYDDSVSTSTSSSSSVFGGLRLGHELVAAASRVAPPPSSAEEEEAALFAFNMMSSADCGAGMLACLFPLLPQEATAPTTTQSTSTPPDSVSMTMTMTMTLGHLTNVLGQLSSDSSFSKHRAARALSLLNALIGSVLAHAAASPDSATGPALDWSHSIRNVLRDYASDALSFCTAELEKPLPPFSRSRALFLATIKTVSTLYCLESDAIEIARKLCVSNLTTLRTLSSTSAADALKEHNVSAEDAVRAMQVIAACCCANNALTAADVRDIFASKCRSGICLTAAGETRVPSDLVSEHFVCKWSILSTALCGSPTISPLTLSRALALELLDGVGDALESCGSSPNRCIPMLRCLRCLLPALLGSGDSAANAAETLQSHARSAWQAFKDVKNSTAALQNEYIAAIFQPALMLSDITRPVVLQGPSVTFCTFCFHVSSFVVLSVLN